MASAIFLLTKCQRPGNILYFILIVAKSILYTAYYITYAVYNHQKDLF